MVEDIVNVLFFHVNAAQDAIGKKMEYLAYMFEKGTAVVRVRRLTPSAPYDESIAIVPTFMPQWSVGTHLKDRQLTGKIMVICKDRRARYALFEEARDKGYQVEPTPVVDGMLLALSA